MGRIIRFDRLESTNKYCEALDPNTVEDFTCYWALEQTAGIGQRGNHWESAAGENLTFSLVLHPTWLPAEQQFRLTEALSLGVLDCINGLKGFNGTKGFNGLNAIVKWPNDIYVGGLKICGMLVSNRLSGDTLGTAICGIGLNANQRVFPEWVPNPTSLSLLTGQQYELESLLEKLLGCIEGRYRQLQNGANLEEEYLSHLLNLGTPARYRHEGRDITATITGVDAHGRLLLTTEEDKEISCGMKEIEFVI